MKYATTSPTHEELQPSKMKIFDLENIQKEDSKDDSQSELSPYDSVIPATKSEKGSLFKNTFHVLN